jgi:hypothetical protein
VSSDVTSENTYPYTPIEIPARSAWALWRYLNQLDQQKKGLDEEGCWQ